MFKDAYYKPASEIMILVEETVEGVIQRECFPDGMCIKVRGRTLAEGKLLFRAKALTDIKLARVEKPVTPDVPEEPSEEHEQSDES
ncbi:MAG: hypothetical protein V2I33_24910 [Kangiellaceae bacterium]|jgi:hypothetical protein|nr:hypothetical protein [Kangiellaceae bacterium]